MDLSAVLAFAVAGPTTITSTLLPGANGNPLISARWPVLTLTVFRTVRKDFAIRMALHLTFRKCTRSASNQQHPIVGVWRGKLVKRCRTMLKFSGVCGMPTGSKTIKPFIRRAPLLFIFSRRPYAVFDISVSGRGGDCAVSRRSNHQPG